MKEGSDITSIRFAIKELKESAEKIGSLIAHRSTTGSVLRSIAKRMSNQNQETSIGASTAYGGFSNEGLASLDLTSKKVRQRVMLELDWFAPAKIYCVTLIDELEHIEPLLDHYTDQCVECLIPSSFPIVPELWVKWKAARSSYWHPTKKNFQKMGDLLEIARAARHLYDGQVIVDNNMRKMCRINVMKGFKLASKLCTDQRIFVLRSLYERRLVRCIFFGAEKEIPQIQKRIMGIEADIERRGRDEYNFQVSNLTVIQREQTKALVDAIFVFCGTYREFNLIREDGEHLCLHPLAVDLPEIVYNEKYEHLGYRFREASIWLHAAVCEIFFLCRDDKRISFDTWLRQFKSGECENIAKNWISMNSNLRVAFDAISTAVLWPMLFEFRRWRWQNKDAPKVGLDTYMDQLDFGNLTRVRNAVAHVATEEYPRLFEGLYFGKIAMPAPVYSLWSPVENGVCRAPLIFGLHEEMVNFAKSKLSAQ